MSESEPLLPVQNESFSKKSVSYSPKRSFKRHVYIFILFILITGTIHGLNGLLTSRSTPIIKQKKKNIVFFVTDGMGPASLSLTRSYRQFIEDLPINDTLTLDKHLIGSSRTRSSNSLITDSAAGATAFSCGLKSYNGAIGVDPLQNPCGTVLEALKIQEGFLTGLVVTTSITDATPAAFSSHVNDRSQEDQIAEQQLGYYPLGRMVDLMIGGGRCHYYGCRSDDRNLIKEAQKDGWTYVGDRGSFNKINDNTSLPLLALLADADIPFDLDRDDKVHPSLEESVKVALKLLNDNSDQGFFLLVEGSRIDHGGHFNDPAAQVNEVLAFDKAFKAVQEFADEHADDSDTFMISTSDHETGGLSVAKQIDTEYPDYLWYPEVLANASHSAEYLVKKFRTDLLNNPLIVEDEKKIKKYLLNEIQTNLGITDLATDELNNLIKDFSKLTMDHLTKLINTRAQIGWSTHGHSAVDVNIYSHGSSEEVEFQIYKALKGNHENTEIGEFLASIMNSSTDKITKLLKDTDHSPRL